MRLNIKDIELANISRFRAQQMGVAMLIIILFHVGLPRFDPFFGLRRMGNIGVDIFLFLSGVGLWFSWMKTPSFRHFLMRRYLRVYPAWLLIACLYYIPRFHGGDWFAWLDLVLDITINWDFWLHDELTFWYIPATMMLYLFAPAYMELIRRHPIYRWLPVFFCLIQLISWSRYTAGNLSGIAGYAKPTSYISVVEATINLVGSIILVQFFDIMGVLIATVAALPLKVVYLNYIADIKIMHRKPWKTLSILGVNYAIFAATVFIKELVTDMVIENYWQFIVAGLVLAVGYSIVVVVFNVLVNRDLLSLFKKVLKRKSA